MQFLRCKAMFSLGLACWLTLAACNALLLGAESPSGQDNQPPNQANDPTTLSGHRFTTGETRSYISETKHVVAWESAGDRLTYTTGITLELSCYVREVTPEYVELSWRVLDLKATHNGPGRAHAVDSVNQIGADDPLLGDLMVYHLVPLTVQLNPTTGAILQVLGTEQLVENLNKRHPPTSPTRPPPRNAIAKKTFDPLQIATLFGRYLAVPGSGDGKLDLGPAVTGHATLAWNQGSYELGLPEDDEHKPRMTLSSNPLPVELSITDLKGTGSTTLPENGILQKAEGNYTMELAATALTQGVKQTHTVQWQLVLIRRTPPQRNESDPEQP